jgi:glutamine amidotransferase
MSGTRVAIIDSGGANIASLSYALDRLGIDSTLTRDAHTIRNASHVILPGVGAAADAMQRLESNHLCEVITGLSQPVLGICLGMQLFAQSSEEDATECLGVIPAIAEKLHVSAQTPVPNMGWCQVRQTESHELFTGIKNDSYFYFVHSFALPEGAYTLARAEHSKPFTAVLAQRNFFATQFHPERSAEAGSKLLSNFASLAS